MWIINIKIIIKINKNNIHDIILRRKYIQWLYWLFILKKKKYNKWSFEIIIKIMYE